eukprot:2933882-Amphidinium_carterae.1
MGRQDVALYLLQTGAMPHVMNMRGQMPEDICSHKDGGTCANYTTSEDACIFREHTYICLFLLSSQRLSKPPGMGPTWSYRLIYKFWQETHI